MVASRPHPSHQCHLPADVSGSQTATMMRPSLHAKPLSCAMPPESYEICAGPWLPPSQAQEKATGQRVRPWLWFSAGMRVTSLDPPTGARWGYYRYDWPADTAPSSPRVSCESLWTRSSLIYGLDYRSGRRIVKQRLVLPFDDVEKVLRFHHLHTGLGEGQWRH